MHALNARMINLTEIAKYEKAEYKEDVGRKETTGRLQRRNPAVRFLL